MSGRAFIATVHEDLVNSIYRRNFIYVHIRSFSPGIDLVLHGPSVS